jgi:hypothetical protein
MAVYSKQVAAVAEHAKDQQASLQAELTRAVDKYYLSKETSQAHSAALQSTINKLRGERHGKCDENGTTRTVLPAIYRVFNQAADHPDLSAAIGSRIPDAEADGLDAVQYSVTEYNRIALQANALIEIIESSPCFISGP